MTRILSITGKKGKGVLAILKTEYDTKPILHLLNFQKIFQFEKSGKNNSRLS